MSVIASSTPVQVPARETHHPMLGVAAVLIGAFISTINTRLTSVGLADIRGGLSLGFDEGSWLSTVFAASQMVVCMSAAWFALVFGPRRLLLWSGAVFCVLSLLPPFTQDPTELLLLQLVRGLAVGSFIPRPSASSCANCRPVFGVGDSPPTRSGSSFPRTSPRRSRPSTATMAYGPGCSGRTSS